MADSELMLLCSCGLLNHSIESTARGMKANIKASAVHCSRALETSLRNVLIAASAFIELHIPKNLEEVGLFTG